MQRTPSTRRPPLEEQFSDEDDALGRPRRRPHRLQFYVLVVVSIGALTLCAHLQLRAAPPSPPVPPPPPPPPPLPTAQPAAAAVAIASDAFVSRYAGDAVRSRQPLGEHPRPQLQRKRWKSLNGLWERNGTRILVPFPPESLLSGVAAGAARGRTAVYRTSFGVPPAWKVDGGASVALHFGAVDWRCRVAVNGVGVAEHSGGFTPFTADVSAALDRSLERQQLEVWVYDPSEEGGQPLGKQRETSRGIWYTAVSGIWQSVWLELRPPTFVSAVSFATVDLRAGRVRVDVEMRAPGAPATADAEIEARLRFAPPSKAIGPSGWWADDAIDGATTVARCTARRRCTPAAGADGCAAATLKCSTEATLASSLPPRAWTPEEPYLHRARLELVVDGAVVDEVATYTALRTVAIQPGVGVANARIVLNGRPTFVAGVLDQGWWPDGLYTAPSDRALYSDIVAAKRLGFNTLRKHAKVEPARWYFHCDRLGVLVLQDMPSPPGLTCRPPHLGDKPRIARISAAEADAKGKSRNGEDDDDRRECALDEAAFGRELREMVESLAWSPSIVMWVVFNEGWGQHATGLRVRQVRALDTTRLVNDASGWLVAATARLGQQKELAPQEDEATNAWLRKATAALACDPRGGAVDCGDVIDVHAYPGPWPKPKHRAEWYGGGLWEQVGWARNSRRASVLGEFGGVKYGLAGHTQTGDGWGYGKKDAADCADFVARIVEVWSRVPAALSGAVYTQLTDVEQEWNGLIAYDRHPKCETTLGPALRRVLAAVQRNASAAAAGGGRPVRLRPQSIFL